MVGCYWHYIEFFEVFERHQRINNDKDHWASLNIILSASAFPLFFWKIRKAPAKKKLLASFLSLSHLITWVLQHYCQIVLIVKAQHSRHGSNSSNSMPPHLTAPFKFASVIYLKGAASATCQGMPAQAQVIHTSSAPRRLLTFCPGLSLLTSWPGTLVLVKLFLWLTIGWAFMVTRPCSSSSHVISEDSDLYRAFKSPSGFEALSEFSRDINSWQDWQPGCCDSTSKCWLRLRISISGFVRIGLQSRLLQNALSMQVPELRF